MDEVSKATEEEVAKAEDHNHHVDVNVTLI